MTGEEELAVRQARDGLALGRELLGARAANFCAKCGHPWHTDFCTYPTCGGPDMLTESCGCFVAHKPVTAQPCSWGDDAWHRAVSRLTHKHLSDFQRLLRQEQDRTEYTRAKMAAQEAGEQP